MTIKKQLWMLLLPTILGFSVRNPVQASLEHPVKLNALQSNGVVAVQPRRLQYDDGPIVPMEEYENELTPGYRVLNCFECFEAKGKMCIDKTYVTLFHKTQSSHEARGICCKPSSTEGFCAPEHPEIVCSMNSYDDDPESKYKNVLSENYRNYQMYAFCPVPEQDDDICGFGHALTDFSFSANSTTQGVQTSKLKHYERAGLDQTQRMHYICHYLIRPQAEAEYDDQAYMMLKFNIIMNVVVRVYEGQTRDTALNPVVEYNGQPSTTHDYRVKWNSGLLVVVIPNENVETQFEFDYWIDQKEKSKVYKYVETKWDEYKKKAEDLTGKSMDDTAIIVVASIVAVFIVVFCFIICYVKCKDDKKKEKQLDEEAHAIQQVVDSEKKITKEGKTKKGSGKSKKDKKGGKKNKKKKKKDKNGFELSVSIGTGSGSESHSEHSGSGSNYSGTHRSGSHRSNGHMSAGSHRVDSFNDGAGSAHGSAHGSAQQMHYEDQEQHYPDEEAEQEQQYPDEEAEQEQEYPEEEAEQEQMSAGSAGGDDDFAGSVGSDEE